MSSLSNQIVIHSNAVNACILDLDIHTKRLINECLTYQVEGAEQNPLFKAHRRDGKASFFNFKKSSFPAGFVYRVAMCLQKNGYKVAFNHKPFPAPLGTMRPEIGNFGYDPRYEYQYLVTERLLRYGQMICQAATGAGKTNIALIAYQTISRPTLFLTTRSILMYQMKEAASALKERTVTDI
jgi:hypothetical protein